MIRSKRWYSALVPMLLIIAACGGNAEQNQSTERDAGIQPTTVPPQTITVTISDDGAFTPNSIAPNPGDTVAFVADGGDVVLCVEPDALFGAERFPIANGSTLTLTAQPEAVHIDFAYVACLGNLEAACGGCRGGEGGGRTGP